MATTPPGWYDDGHGALRWWDGAQWTEHVAAPDPETGAEGTAPTEAEIVAASEAEAESQRAAAEVDAAAALGFGIPPVGVAPEYPAAATHPQGAYPDGAPSQTPGLQTGPPSGYPGADAATGAFTAATEPRKSNLWILWVVLGVVMLGIVIAAAIVIPLIFLSLSSGSQSGVDASGPDQEAAVAAVELYDDAWQNVDCDAYVASTTEAFRESTIADCESFTAEATAFSAGVSDYALEIVEIEVDGDTIVISTNETYDSLVDEDGAPLDEPTAEEIPYEYTLVSVDGEWVIDDITN